MGDKTGIEFVRNIPGLNKTGSPNSTIFQHTLCEIGNECYVAVDIDKECRISDKLYTTKQFPQYGDTDNINWKEDQNE